MKLNLGCGDDIKKGYINVDSCKLPRVDVVCNLEKKFPFKSDSADEVIAENIIEHLNEPYKFMEEIWRVCKDNAKVLIVAPHVHNRVLDGKLPHKRPGINAYTFGSLDEGQRYNYYSKMRFKIIQIKYKLFYLHFLTSFLEKHLYLTEYIVGRWVGIDSCQVELRAIKKIPKRKRAGVNR